MLTAYVPPLFGERNVDDNKVDSLTVVKLRMIGDVNGDGKVDMRDVAIVSQKF